MGLIYLCVRKWCCLSVFCLSFCLCGFRFATAVEKMLLPLLAFIICFARMPFFGVPFWWKPRWWFPFAEWCSGKRHRLSAIMHRLCYTQPFCCWQEQCLSFLLSFVQSCGHFPALMPGDSVSKSESFSVRNIFLCSRFPETDRSRSLIILSLMNRTQPVCTIFRFSQTSADGLTRKIRMEDGKGSPLQMAGRLRCRSRRQRRQRKCFLMRQTGSVLRRKPEEIGAI